MRKLVALAGVVAFVATSCIGGNSNTRTVLVDFSHDQFASFFTQYFPHQLAVHPGDTIVFRQTWTGEPHSVTMGTIADQYAKLIERGGIFKAFEKGGYEALPGEAPKAIQDFENRKLVWMVDDNGKVNQDGAQPCFLSHGYAPRKNS